MEVMLNGVVIGVIDNYGNIVINGKPETIEKWKLDHIKSEADKIRKRLEGARLLGEPLDLENKDMVLLAGFYVGLQDTLDHKLKQSYLEIIK